MTKFTLLFIMTLMASGCSSSTDYFDTTPIESELIAQGNLPRIGADNISNQYFSLRNQTDWVNFINRIDPLKESSSELSQQNIDFSKYIVIAVVDEVRSTSGYKIDLEIETNNKQIFIGSRRSSPDPEEFVLTVLTQPYHIVKIAKTNLPIDIE